MAAEIADALEEEIKRHLVVKLDAVKLHHDFGLDIEMASRLCPQVVRELVRRGYHAIRYPWGSGYVVSNDREVLRQIERLAKRSSLEAIMVEGGVQALEGSSKPESEERETEPHPQSDA